MPLTGFVGHAQALDAREAGSQAALKAVGQLGRNPASIGILIASDTVPVHQAASGASALLGDAPLFGFSTSAELTSDGYQQHSVVVAVLSSSDLSVKADWWPDFAEDSPSTAQKIAQSMLLKQSGGTLLIAADGFSGDIKELGGFLPEGDYLLAGCLAGGDLRQAHTFQIAGRQTGSGGLAAALLSGKLVTGIGIAHGWQPVGLYYRVTSAEGSRLHCLDGKPVAEIYAQAFGYAANEWSIPPLREMVRLYPLGIDQGKDRPLLVRSPLFMEDDGSLLMHTTIPQDCTAHLMIGSAENCLKAAEQAAAQALEALNGAQPVLALVLVDDAWRSLLEARAGSEIQAVQKVIGPEIPIAGGYVYGQLAPGSFNQAQLRGLELYNQSIEVILFAEARES